MGKKETTLADDVLAAFQRACQEDDLKIAEYLLLALEELAQRTPSENDLNNLYLCVLRTLGTRPWH